MLDGSGEFEREEDEMREEYDIGEMVWVRRMREDDWIGVVVNKRMLRSDIIYDVLYNGEIRVVSEGYLLRMRK